MQTLHLCGGLGAGMLADLINGHTPIAYVEKEEFLCQVIRDRCAEGWFPGLAIHQCDLQAFDGRPYAGRVDCVSAGWPCQNISRMGDREGLDGDRSGLWSEVARILSEIRPAYAFFENGPDIVDLGLDRVLCDLARLGYDARWGRISAGNAGASHGRERWWCLAHRVPLGLEGIVRGGGSDGGSLRKPWPTILRSDFRGSRRLGYAGGAMNTGTTLTDACLIHQGEATGRAGSKPRQMVLPNPEFCEWLMRMPGGWSKPASPASATARMCSALLRPGDSSEGRSHD